MRTRLGELEQEIEQPNQNDSILARMAYSLEQRVELLVKTNMQLEQATVALKANYKRLLMEQAAYFENRNSSSGSTDQQATSIQTLQKAIEHQEAQFEQYSTINQEQLKQIKKKDFRLSHRLSRELGALVPDTDMPGELRPHAKKAKNR